MCMLGPYKLSCSSCAINQHMPKSGRKVRAPLIQYAGDLCQCSECVYTQYSRVEMLSYVPAVTKCSCSAWLIILGLRKTKHSRVFWHLAFALSLSFAAGGEKIRENFAATSAHPLGSLYCGKHSSVQTLLSYVETWAWITPKAVMQHFSHSPLVKDVKLSYF